MTRIILLLALAIPLAGCAPQHMLGAAMIYGSMQEFKKEPCPHNRSCEHERTK